MSVVVKGMDIPECCRECPFENYYSDTGKTVCMASLRVLAIGFGVISFDGRHSSCPLVALPDHHGRLVDADALRDRLRSLADDGWNKSTTTSWAEAFSECADMVDEAPTIEPQRKEGRWTKENACEFCGFQPWFERDIHTLSFCPNCGADMRDSVETARDIVHEAINNSVWSDTVDTAKMHNVVDDKNAEIRGDANVNAES